MAIFYQQVLDEHTRLGIWRIEEAEDFFLQHVPLHNHVSHPYKRLQHLAGRYLLKHLFPDFPLHQITIADTKKPFLPDEAFHFSISHCGNYAAAIVSTHKRVGIDIELITPRLHQIATRFLNENELAVLRNWEYMSQMHLQLTTIMWSAKEAMFKWYGNGKVDFRKHLKLDGDITMHSDEHFNLPFVFHKNEPVHTAVMAKIFNPLVLAYTVTPATIKA